LCFQLSLCKIWLILDIGKVSDLDFNVWKIENLEKSETSWGPLVSGSGRLNGLRRSPVRARDTVCDDAKVTVRRRWPPPHMVTTLSSRKVEQMEVSPILPSSTCMPRHCSALPPSAVDTLLVPATSVRRPDSTLHPRASPSCHGARRPHHRCPQLLLRAPVASSPPPPFLHELTDDRPLRPSPGPVSTTCVD
jgi:hypothetical protein